MRIQLRPLEEAYFTFYSRLEEWILKNKFKKICEIGAGPNPSLTAEFVSKNGIEYHLFDKEKTELEKGTSPFKYEAIDFCQENLTLQKKYDFVISKMVLEHVEYPDIFHKNVFSILEKEGVAMHFFATLYSIPTLANILLPEWLSSNIVKKLQKNRNFETEGKFPAFYRRCSGPSQKAIKYFQNKQYQIIEYSGFLGHFYFRDYKLLYPLEKAFSKFLMYLNSPKFTTSSIIILQKPANVS